MTQKSMMKMIGNYLGNFILLAYSILGGFFMNENLWGKVEKKTKVNKNTIMDLASKLSNSNMKDKNTLLEIIDELSNLTGREVSDEKKEKIINAIINDKVPKNIDEKF